MAPSPSAVARAETYRTLAECFKEPTPGFADDVVAGRLHDALTDALGPTSLGAELDALRIRGDAGDVFRRLRDVFHSLFTVPSARFVLPVESAFKEWRAGDGLAVGGGMIMGPPAVDMAARYRARGLEPPASFRDTPDHLTLLLEYAALLAEEETGEEHRDFVATHLDDWVGRFVGDVETLSPIDFYRAAARALRAFVSAERRELVDAK